MRQAAACSAKQSLISAWRGEEGGGVRRRRACRSSSAGVESGKSTRMSKSSAIRMPARDCMKKKRNRARHCFSGA